MARHKPKEAHEAAPAVVADAGPSVRAVELPVVTVTVLEDRAHVIRRGGLALAAAGERVRVERIAPVASDKTLAVAVVEGSGVKVVDARIRRRAVVRLREPDAEEPVDRRAEREALERERDELLQTIDGQRAEREVAARQGAALERAAALALAELAEDVGWGVEVEATWAERLDELGREQRSLGRGQAELDRELERLEAALARLGERIAGLDGPAEEERADLEIDLVGPAGAGCVLRVDYAVPGACWRPCHTARLSEDAGSSGRAAQVELDTDACVWQNTGEDWREVELVLSTERSSLGIEPPHLGSDVLRAVKRSDQVVVETREQEIDTSGLGLGSEATAARAVTAELPGIDDAGQVLTWRAPERASIPTDGRPYRVRLGSFRAEAEVELVGFPELSHSVLLKSTQENRSAGPLLAGPVDLLRASGLCGRTSIRYVAPGERFELGWGPDADLRVSREVEALDEKSRMLSSWSVRRTLVRIKISNLGGEGKRLTVTERLPVSEIEKVRVSIDPERVTGRRRPDENGFLHWAVALEPFGHDELELVWELRRHDDVTGV
jgi:uncharacterized protein (TIGR02231 family)